MPLMGRLSDAWGHRRLFIISMAAFMVGSVAVALTPSGGWVIGLSDSLSVEVPGLSWLIAARVFQAVGAGALVPISIAIAGDLFPPGRRGISLGLIGASVEAGGVIGPLWGGVVPKYMDRLWEVAWFGISPDWLSELGWRWVFWMNIPLGVAVIVALVFLVSPSPRHPARVDFLGGGLIALSFVALTLGLARIGAPDSVMAGYLLLSAGAFILFIMRQRAAVEPLLPASMFRGRAFNSANATHVLVGGALIVAMVTIPLMANTALALTPLEGGLRLMRLTAAMAVGALLGGVASQQVDYRIPAFLGLAMAAAGFLFMSGWDVEIADPELTMHLALTGLGFGLLIAPIVLAATESVGEENRGTAAASVSASRLVGMTFGLAALSAWGSGRFQDLAGGIQLPFAVPEDTAVQTQQRLLEFDADLIGAGMTLFSEFFLIAMGVCLVAMVPVLFMAWHTRR